MAGKELVFRLTEAEARCLLELLLIEGAEQNEALIQKIHGQLVSQGGSFAGGGNNDN